MLATLRIELRAVSVAVASAVSVSSLSCIAQAVEPTTWHVQSHWPGASSADQDGLVRLNCATGTVYPTETVLKRSINSLADLQGLKIRSSGSLQSFLTDAGATAS